MGTKLYVYVRTISTDIPKSPNMLPLITHLQIMTVSKSDILKNIF